MKRSKHKKVDRYKSDPEPCPDHPERPDEQPAGYPQELSRVPGRLQAQQGYVFVDVAYHDVYYSAKRALNQGFGKNMIDFAGQNIYNNA